MPAYYPLDDVQNLVTLTVNGIDDKVVFSMRSASINYIMHIFNCSVDEAKLIIYRGLMLLTNNDFKANTAIGGGLTRLICDEYGLQGYRGHNWYIKLAIEDGDLDSISFHPVERNMRIGQRVLTVTLPTHLRPSWRPR